MKMTEEERQRIYDALVVARNHKSIPLEEILKKLEEDPWVA